MGRDKRRLTISNFNAGNVLPASYGLSLTHIAAIYLLPLPTFGDYITRSV
jgi:hypothetical protein